MKTYELTYIISPEIPSIKIDVITKDVESFVQSKEGVILKSEKIGAQPLSYLIKKQSSGYFNVATFQIEGNKIKEIKDNLDKNDKVLRSVIVVKKPAKVMKERRIRKPLFMQEKVAPDFTKTEKKYEGKVELEEIEKKLDEILNQ